MGLFDKKETDVKVHIKRIEKVVNAINDGEHSTPINRKLD